MPPLGDFLYSKPVKHVMISQQETYFSGFHIKAHRNAANQKESNTGMWCPCEAGHFFSFYIIKVGLILLSKEAIYLTNGIKAQHLWKCCFSCITKDFITNLTHIHKHLKIYSAWLFNASCCTLLQVRMPPSRQMDLDLKLVLCVAHT